MSEKFRIFIVDPVPHCEGEIDDQIEIDGALGELTELHVPTELECCTKCGATYPVARTCCPWLLFLAVEMLEPLGNHLEIPASKRAHEFVMTKKDEVKDWWIVIKPKLDEEQTRRAQRSLIRLGLLTEHS